MKGEISKKDKIIGVLLYIGFVLVVMVAIAMIAGGNLGEYQICKRACWRYSAVGGVVDFKIVK